MMQLTGSLSRLVLLTFLFAAAWLDQKTGELPLILSGAGATAGTLFCFFTGSSEFPELLPGFLLGFLPGMLLLALAFFSKQAVGYGDGAIFLAAGTFLGIEKTVWLLVCALLAAGVVSLLLLVLKKRNKKTSVPVIPFVLAGYVLLLIWI